MIGKRRGNVLSTMAKKKKSRRIGDMSKLARLEFDPPRVITINRDVDLENSDNLIIKYYYCAS